MALVPELLKLALVYQKVQVFRIIVKPFENLQCLPDSQHGQKRGVLKLDADFVFERGGTGFALV